MIKVMHIAQASVGGVERYLYSLLKSMDSSKYENVLVLASANGSEKFIDVSTAIEFVGADRNISLLSDLKATRELRRLIKKHNPDVLYLHSSKAGALGRLANLGHKNVSVYNAHGWSFNIKCGAFKRNIYALIERILGHFCTHIIAISKFEKESALKRHVGNATKMSVIYNGVDLDEGTKETDDDENVLIGELERICEDQFIVGCVARLAEQKAPDVFLRAAQAIKQQIPNAFFMLVGDGELKADCEAMAKDLGLQNSLMITGWVPNPRAYIQRFDVALLLSRWEGFGLAIAEYMREEKPVVATNTDAIPDLILDQWNGILVNIDDHQAAAEAVVTLHNDRELSKRLAANGVDTVKRRFNVQRVADEHDALFEALLSARMENRHSKHA